MDVLKLRKHTTIPTLSHGSRIGGYAKITKTCNDASTFSFFPIEEGMREGQGNIFSGCVTFIFLKNTI